MRDRALQRSACSLVCRCCVGRRGRGCSTPARRSRPRIIQPPPDTGPPRREISDLTKRVAARHCPPARGERPFVARTLIDRQLADAWTRDNIPHAPLSNDDEFCRRVYLDLTGRIPTPEQLLAFVDDTDARTSATG